MNSRRIFSRTDWFCGLGAFLVSLAVYVYTAAPNVTLLDSGEFLVAAGHFGVPHPTGYPLWTLTSWLFQLLPLGNMAWEVAVWSGVCSAGAVGIVAMMGNNMLRWMGFFPEAPFRWVNIVVSISLAFTLAFSFSVWSQAVIAEVYGLHALMTAIFFLLLYLWVHGPQRDRLMIGAFFVLALSFSNHHLTLVLSPLPFLLILLLRRRAFWDWVLAAMVTALLVYLGFAILSGEVLVLKTAIRLAYCVGIGGAFLLWRRRLHVRIKLIAFLPFAVIAGLLPYLYMPLASSTNPPMNWSYTREATGFFYSINRSQYQGPLSEQTIKTLGRFMGTYPGEQPRHEIGKDRSKREVLMEWAGFFWLQLNRSFTPFSVIFYFCSIIAALRLPLNRRTWIYLLHIGFVLAAFLQPILDGAEIDAAGWWLQMPYHTYTNLIFTLLCIVGGGYILEALAKRRAPLVWLTALLPLMPVYGFLMNFSEASQRNHWFGWMFGHDMLKDLPKGSIVIGGSDPGRFVPTYMIFGESPQPAALKRDPSFDRRDLYIITQNALGESNYMKYLRDHYTTARPEPKSAFEKWLGREHTYPKDPIVLPSPEECETITKEASTKSPELARKDPATFEMGTVLKWIWEKNKDKHDFFVEESFPIEWTYDYAIPHGLIYQLSKTKLDQLPPEAVAKDFAFWKDYKARLLNDPAFASDYDAQRSFSKLRQTMGNIYRYRKMTDEAIRAYYEALELWPENGEVLASLTRLLWDKGDFDTSSGLLKRALEKDFNNIQLWRFAIMADERKKTEGEIQSLKDALAKQPRNREIISQIIDLYARVDEAEKAQAIVQKAMTEMPDDPAMLRIAATYYGMSEKWQDALAPAESLTRIEPGNAQNFLLLARVYYALDKKKEFYAMARKAIELGGVSMRDQILNDDFFKSWRGEPEFQSLAQPGGNISPSGGVPPSSGTQPATSSTEGQEHMMLRSP